MATRGFHLNPRRVWQRRTNLRWCRLVRQHAATAASAPATPCSDTYRAAGAPLAATRYGSVNFIKIDYSGYYCDKRILFVSVSRLLPRGGHVGRAEIINVWSLASRTGIPGMAGPFPTYAWTRYAQMNDNLWLSGITRVLHPRVRS